MTNSFTTRLLLLGSLLPVFVIAAPTTGVFPPGNGVPKSTQQPAGQFPPLPSNGSSPASVMPASPALPSASWRPAQLYPQHPQRPPQMGYRTPNYQLSRMTPFGNSFSPNRFLNTLPAPWSNGALWNPWHNGNNYFMPFFPAHNTNKKKAWGDTRHIWPDFYTDFTEEIWDKGINAPYDAGRMPGGWRAPSLSSPDPVTVGDAVLNQFPPIMEEMGNMIDFSNN